MAWYVFALVDVPPDGRAGSGLSGALSVRRVPGGFAVVERRADVPPIEFDTLRQHDAVVSRLADAVPAILPVRFGTLLELGEIEDALAEREEEMAEAFDTVRGRVQFTWRRVKTGRRDLRPGGRGQGSEPRSGVAYLRRAARAAKPAAPAAFRGVREKLKPVVAAERYLPATASLPESLYHLVDGRSARRYRTIADRLSSVSVAVNVTGPFPPFAFAAELL
jgi:Gas vesicle synthesis protein GvpL/GvpF